MINSEKKPKARKIKKSAGGGGGGDDYDDGGSDDDDDDDNEDDDGEWDIDWNDEGEDNDPSVHGEVADGCDLEEMDGIREAIRQQKDAYIQVATALKAVNFVIHMHSRHISIVKEHHVKLRNKAMTLQGLINARSISGSSPSVSSSTSFLYQLVYFTPSLLLHYSLFDFQ